MNKNVIRFFILGLLVGLIISFFQFDLGKYLTLDYLKSQQDQFSEYYQENPLTTIAVYMAVYIISTAVSFPGASLLTLLGGGLFGLVNGTIIVSFASTIGATLAFLTARFILRDWVQDKFKKQLKSVNAGIEREGAFYLFTLRLIPIVPFFVVNLVMGLTPMKTWTYFWVSQVGMFAGTVVYVNAGTQLAQIESLKGILSPSLILSFCILGLFPIITKKILFFFKKKKVEA